MATRIISTNQVQDNNNNSLTNIISNLSSSSSGSSQSIPLAAGGVATFYPTSYPVLNIWYTASNIAPNTYPKVYCTDVGLCQWTGTVWAPLHPFNILSSGVPMGIAPNGSVGVNGALTLGTPLDRIYSLTNTGGCYLKFPFGALYTSSPQATYYVIMSSTTSGTVYDNQYSFGNPVIPASPKAIVSGAMPAYTQNSGAYNTLTGVDLLNGILPANCTGLNGEIRISYVWTCSSSSGNKQLILGLGSNNSYSLSYDQETTATVRAGTTYVRFQGATDGQVSINSFSGDNGTGTGINIGNVPTSNNQSLAIRGLLATGPTDWIMLQSATVQVTSSLLMDKPASYQPQLAGPTMVPPGAAAAGFNTNAYFLRPTLTDIGFSNSTANAFYTSGTGSSNSNNFSMTATTYTPSGQVLTILGGLGGNEYCLTNAQRPNATSVAGGLGTLPYLVPGTGFYAEWQFWLSDNYSDHWAACWMLPMEHNSIQGDRPPGGAVAYEAYAELDAIETGLWGNEFGAHWHGALQTLIDWYGYYNGTFNLTTTPLNGDTSGTLANTWPNPSGTQTCVVASTGQTLTATLTNACNHISFGSTITGTPSTTALTFKFSNTDYHNAYGAPFDWTIPHTVAVRCNPADNTIAFFFDGVLQQSYTYANYNIIANYHYYQIVDLASNDTSLLRPYYMHLGYVQAWTP